MGSKGRSPCHVMSKGFGLDLGRPPDGSRQPQPPTPNGGPLTGVLNPRTLGRVRPGGSPVGVRGLERMNDLFWFVGSPVRRLSSRTKSVQSLGRVRHPPGRRSLYVYSLTQRGSWPPYPPVGGSPFRGSGAEGLRPDGAQSFGNGSSRTQRVQTLPRTKS